MSSDLISVNRKLYFRVPERFKKLSDNDIDFISKVLDLVRKRSHKNNVIDEKNPPHEKNSFISVNKKNYRVLSGFLRKYGYDRTAKIWLLHTILTSAYWKFKNEKELVDTLWEQWGLELPDVHEAIDLYNKIKHQLKT